MFSLIESLLRDFLPYIIDEPCSEEKFFLLLFIIDMDKKGLILVYCYIKKTFHRKIVNYVLIIVHFYSVRLTGLNICISEHN